MSLAMLGSLPEYGLNAGFLGSLPYDPGMVVDSVPIISRGVDFSKPNTPVPENILRRMQALAIGGPGIERVDITGDVSQVMSQLNMTMSQLQRAITSTTSGLPVRENLEAEAAILVPLETPVRNMLPRRAGSGLSSQWRTVTSLGGGYASATTTTSATSAAQSQSIPVASSAGFSVGNYVYLDTGANQEYLQITAIADGTHITVTTAIAVHASGSPVVNALSEPGTSAGTIQSFFSESGAPAAHTTAYLANLKTFKLLGSFGSVTGLAAAGGATFQNQLVTEKQHALMNLMLNEENAILNAISTSALAPWGDGTNALAFDGMNNSITTANGTPADHVQTSVGALTTAHIDAQLKRLWLQGAIGKYMILNGQEVTSLVHLAEGSGSIIRVQATTSGGAVLGLTVTGYADAITGEVVPILASRFQPAGTMIFGCKQLPDGRPASDIEVLPQVQLPELAPNQQIQGYTVQEIAPSATAPQVYPFICTVYEVFRMKSALHFAQSSGVTAV